MKGSFWIIAVLVVSLTVGALAIPAAVANSADTVTVENEPQTLDENGTQLAEASDESTVVIYDNETVTVGNDTLVSGEDYQFNNKTGIITPTNSTVTGDEALVNYSVAQTDGRTGAVASLLGLFGPIWPLLVVAAVFATLWGMITSVWS